MDNFLNLYNTLLGIEVATFGIISGVILVFIQLVYANYTYKHVWRLLRNRWLVLFFICGTLDLILTSAGSFFLTIAGPGASSILTRRWYLLVALFLIFVSISFFATLVVKNISYLQPHRAIFMLSNDLRYEDIRDYLWKKYPLEPPHNLELRIENEIAAIEKRVANTEDHLLPIRDMMIQFMRRADLVSLTEAKELLLSVSNGFVEAIPKNAGGEWSPEDALLGSYTRYIIELLSTLLEISEREGLESAKRVVLDVSYGYADECLKIGSYEELNLVHKFLREVADKSIGQSSIIVENILDHYEAMGEEAIDLLKDKPPEDRKDLYQVLDDIFRCAGWLGERLLMQLPIEESPLMYNAEYGTEYDALLNCLLPFEDRYECDLPDAYPLIYFDALFVVQRQIIKINQKAKNRRLDADIYRLAGVPASFAEQAMQVGNSDGAALAALKVEQSYREIKGAGLNALASDVIKLLVKIGMLAAGNSEKLHPVGFMDQPLDQCVTDKLVASGENLDHAIFNCYTETSEVCNQEAIWDFITKLGMRLGSNFGFEFDPSTGELYPDDDPRRR